MITLTNVAQIRITPAFGWIADPPKANDLSLARNSRLLSLGAVTQDELDVSQFFRPVSDQLSFPSCTANACVDAAESQNIINNVDAGIPLDKAIAATPDLSRMFAWFNGRQLMDPPRGYDASSGCYNRLALNGILRHGLCTESRWPYDATNATKRPSLMSYREAFAHTYEAFYAIKETGEERLKLIVQALAARHSVVFGTALDQSVKGYKAGILHKPQSEIIGRHAMVIVGWSKAKSAFKVRNSWSRYWGEQGYCWMHTDYIIDYSETNSFWTLTKGALA